MRSMLPLTVTALLLLSPAVRDAAFAGRIDVPDDYTQLQDAIYAASVGDTIVIDGGDYDWHDIAMKSGVVIKGTAGAPSYVVIDAGGLGRHFICEDVVAQPDRYANSDTRIEDVTLINGVANGTGIDGKGGSILCIDSSLELEDVVFAGNSASVEGGALYMEGLGCEVVSCSFDNNSCDGAGGAVALRNTTGNPMGDPIQNQLGNCFFHYNTAGRGGALALFGEDIETLILGAVFEENEAPYNGARAEGDHAANSGLGGAAYADSLASMELRSCDFLENSSGHAGGGLYVGGGAAPSINFCYFYMNDSVSYGGGICAEYAGPISMVGFYTLADDIFKDNTAWEGGAVYLYETPGVSIGRMAFLGNGAPTGGAVRVDYGSDCDLWVCLFANNLGGTGHAIDARGANSLSLESCTLAANRSLGAYGDGGTIHLSDSSANTTIYDSVIAFNSTVPVACSVTVTSADIDIDCTNIYDNAEGDWVGCIEDFRPRSDAGTAWANISTDPLFCDMNGDEGYEHDDFHLCSNSPCLNDHPSNPCAHDLGSTTETCGDCDSPVNQMSWGSIKALYR